ncbi:beta-hydroxyacyl-ACP dehydratase [Odoribacter sp. OttesenSCG-928-L07]|nr:beta-hydroxyacyl-ACP dehydratase [Odoribacter sp. OttesenSCG-928-L07]MDL2238896.1 beta-hydroxyacyl-ACP dehydratase [Bacteroidales bacterium OttesenSCG-928-L14]MDL2240636.1 beta-hydroxyacyl-ACP dehydratase [Bacteroidales bacterium OttesenSCG-928-K22]
MLINDFFSITNYSHTDYSADFKICLNNNHAIYQAHFPNYPITPGVCTIQIAKELFNFLKQSESTIKKIKNLKFTHPLIPTTHSEVNFHLIWEDIDDENLTRIKVVVKKDDIIFSKMNMQLMITD